MILDMIDGHTSSSNRHDLMLNWEKYPLLNLHDFIV